MKKHYRHDIHTFGEALYGHCYCMKEWVGTARRVAIRAQQAQDEALRTFKRTQHSWPTCCGEPCKVLHVTPYMTVIQCGAPK